MVGTSKCYELINKEIGSFKIKNVIRKTINNKHRWYCICDCQCGKTDLHILYSSIKHHRSKSCGCDKSRYNKTSGSNNKQFTGHCGISGKFYGDIKRKAEKRGYTFNIDIKFLWDLFLQQNKKCMLSDIELTITNKRKTTTASLDRIDSNKDYVAGNLQWVHKDVNIMKNVFEQDYFIDICSKIFRKYRCQI